MIPKSPDKTSSGGHRWLRLCVLGPWLACLLPGARAVENGDVIGNAARWANTVVLDETGVRNLRLKTEEVSEQVLEETFFALGRIEVRPGRAAAVSSRIAGRAVAVHALLDHAVQAGETLVEVESRLAGDPPPVVSLKAPLSGLVSEVKIVMGGPVSPEASLVHIVDLGSVYALARVPQHVGERLRPGLKARLRVPGWAEGEWEARLEHIGALADAASGTMEAAFLVENPELRLRPGMRVEFSLVLGEREGVTVVPRVALQGDPASRFLYVAEEALPHAFVKVPVETGAMNERYVEIARGLLPGDRVVTEGAYSLAFAGKGTLSLKEALDAAHGHEHNPDGSEIRNGSEAVRDASPVEDDHGHAHEMEPVRDRTAAWSPWLAASVAGNVLLVILLAVAGRRPAADGVVPTPRASSSEDEKEPC